jgi:uncharacterized protein YndB with AHSA1/START domain
MTTDTPRVRVSRRFDASAERVFDAWLDPEKAGKFLFATPTGTMVRAEIDPRVGGTFCFVDRRDGEDVAHTGTYLEIDRPRRLVFSFAVPKYSAATTRVIVEIVPREAGCELTLTHEGVLPEYRDRTRRGVARRRVLRRRANRRRRAGPALPLTRRCRRRRARCSMRSPGCSTLIRRRSTSPTSRHVRNIMPT